MQQSTLFRASFNLYSNSQEESHQYSIQSQGPATHGKNMFFFSWRQINKVNSLFSACYTWEGHKNTLQDEFCGFEDTEVTTLALFA